MEQVEAERLLFDSDSPLYFTARQKARIECADMGKDARRAILHDNAARLLDENATTR